MLRIFSIPNSGLPNSFHVAKEGSFQPGQIAQFFNTQDSKTCGVNNGGPPAGIIDDIRVRHFTNSVVNEVVKTYAIQAMTPHGYLVTPVSIKIELRNTNIEPESFVSTISDVMLSPRNGVLTFPAGTKLNFTDYSYVNNINNYPHSHIFNAIKTEVSYRYAVPNVPGDDSTVASGKVTVWDVDGLIFETDQMNLGCSYVKGDLAYIGNDGRLTTTMPSLDAKPVATVVEPFTSSTVKFKWFKQQV